MPAARAGFVVQVRDRCAKVTIARERFSAVASDRAVFQVDARARRKTCTVARNPANGAAQESNLPSVGLRRRTGFEDQLGHRTRPLRAERSEGAQGGRADLELPDSGGRYSD
jgi:hypothetical protein